MDVIYVYKFYKHSIFSLKIFVMKHLYVSLISYLNYTLKYLFILDYLLSNNHVNSIILHKFDFTDEEITAYYISFIKTLSFKLNTHSINFFYNEVWNNKFRIGFECFVLFREIMNFHYMLKQLNFLIIRKQWFVLLYEHWHWIFIKVNIKFSILYWKEIQERVFLCLVSDPAMHRFILDRTATEYFSNLVWCIRNHVLQFDELIRNNRE